MQKSIVIFYIWAGHTRKMAEVIAKQTGADLLEIKPKIPYTQDYNAVVSQAKKEIMEGYLPPIEKIDHDLSKYDTIYIGTPIWWGTLAPPLTTFLKEQDFSGKIILPFSTHGGGGKGHSDKDIAQICTGAKTLNMYTGYEGGTEKEITAWIQAAHKTI